MDSNVFVTPCESYDKKSVDDALQKLLTDNHLLDFIHKGSKVAIKTNLVASSKPEEAIITHPSLLVSLCEILIKMGASVVVGDSPGGLFNDAVLKGIYHRGGLEEIAKTGAVLNHNFNVEEHDIENGLIVKKLDCTSYLKEADVIINFAKMKAHGMMSLSAATKNMFGSVPGPTKLEYHYRYPSHEDFAKMLIDIQNYYKVSLHIVDAIDAMEGNGPTNGTPKHIGLLLASENCFNLDIACCKLMNLDILSVPTVKESIAAGLSVKSFDELKVNMDITPYIAKDFKNIEHMENIEFYSDKKGGSKLIGNLAKKIMMVKPNPNKKECIGCKKCHDICPAKAITMEKGKPVIDRYKCIRCFCCQEFCPVGAMKTKRTLIARIISNKKK